jgi:cysteinyl-tRNA synthetase
MGVAEARNVGLQQSRGRYILFLQSSAELTGDIFSPLASTLAPEEVGLTGPRGLQTDNLRHFEETQETEVEAIDGSCMAFKRALLKKSGLLDEHYRYPQYMDIDFSFALRNSAVSALRTPDLSLVIHPELQPAILSDAEQTRVTKRNFYRYLQKWGDRDDLLLYTDEDEDEDEDEIDEEEQA